MLPAVARISSSTTTTHHRRNVVMMGTYLVPRVFFVDAKVSVHDMMEGSCAAFWDVVLSITSSAIYQFDVVTPVSVWQQVTNKTACASALDISCKEFGHWLHFSGEHAALPWELLGLHCRLQT